MSDPIVVHTTTIPRPGSKVRVKLSSISVEDRLVLAIAGTGATIVLVAGGKIATTALLLSVMTLGSGMILWVKMPNDLGSIPALERALKLLPISKEKRSDILECDWKSVAEKHEVALDIIASIAVFLLYGATLTGLIAAGLTGVGFSVAFKIKSILAKRGAHV
jgi:hypothetical protein